FLLAPPDDAVEGAAVVVHPAGDGLELALWWGRQLVQSRTVPLPDDQPAGARMAAEVRRTVMSYRGQTGGDAVQRLYALGALAPDDLDALAAAADKPVAAACDDLVDADGQVLGSEYVVAWLAARGRLAGVAPPVDFLAPKRPVVVRNATRSQKMLAAAVLVLVPLGLYSNLQLQLRERTRRIDFQRKQLTALADEVKKAQPTLQRHASIRDWKDGDVDWLRELVDLTGSLPDTTKVVLTQLEGIGGGPGKPATIRLTGRAQTQTSVVQTQTGWALETIDHYVVHPMGMNPVARAAGFPWQFDVELELKPLTTEQYVERAGDAHSRFRLASMGSSMVRQPASLELVAAPPATSGSATVTAAPAAPGAAPAPAAEADDPLAALIARIKALPYEEREKEIDKAPSFLRAKLRERLKDSLQQRPNA
ncbi:MAG: hypothetical protein ACRDD1_00830, partial [Planctomycetia bacterium]